MPNRVDDIGSLPRWVTIEVRFDEVLSVLQLEIDFTSRTRRKRYSLYWRQAGLVNECHDTTDKTK